MQVSKITLTESTRHNPSLTFWTAKVWRANVGGSVEAGDFTTPEAALGWAVKQS